MTVGTALSHDIMRKGSRKKFDEKFMLLASRVIIAIVGCIALFLALFKPPSFLALLLYFGIGGIASSIIGPLLLTLYSKKITKRACEISIIASFILYILISFKQFGIGLNVFQAGVVGIAFSITLTYVLSLVTKQTISEETLNKVSQVLNDCSLKSK